MGNVVRIKNVPGMCYDPDADCMEMAEEVYFCFLDILCCADSDEEVFVTLRSIDQANFYIELKRHFVESGNGEKVNFKFYDHCYYFTFNGEFVKFKAYVSWTKAEQLQRMARQ